MTDRRPAAYICTCSEMQLACVGCDCTAERVKIINVDIRELNSGLYCLTFNGAIRGDCAKFNYRDARVAAASWDGKEDGEWKGGEWIDTVYRCAWGAGLAWK